MCCSFIPVHRQIWVQRCSPFAARSIWVVGLCGCSLASPVFVFVLAAGPRVCFFSPGWSSSRCPDFYRWFLLVSVGRYSLLRIQQRPRICFSLHFPRPLQDPSSSHFSLTGDRAWVALLVFFTGCSQASVLRHFLSLKFHVLRSQLLPKESVMPQMSCPRELFFRCQIVSQGRVCAIQLSS
jgi:hypothetical protein